MALRLAVLLLAAAALSPQQRQLNIDSFEHVWSTVRDKHWDPKLGGLDWQAIHDELRPKIEKAETMDEARGIMSDMLARLKETHFAIVPAAVYEDVGGSGGGGEGSPGIDVRVIEDHALVTSVEAGSPAAAKGVKPGWEIVRVDGKPLAPSLESIASRFRDSTLLHLMLSSSVLRRLTGPQAESVAVEFRDAENRRVSARLARAAPRGSVTTLGNLPPLHFWVESRRIEPEIGYVRFNAFFEPETLIRTVGNAVRECGDCRGFIVDVRGNPGGIGGLAMGLSGWFIDKPGRELGAMYMRGAKLKFVVFPQPAAFAGPLAVLVDGCSASTAEIFAGGLQDLKRARIFGTHTAGAALPSMFEKLPNGDGFQYAVANYISEGGRPLEGVGVTPDETAPLTRADLLAGRDNALDRALAWIHNQRN
jgi:carboxyl-terminal processing protease